MYQLKDGSVVVVDEQDAHLLALGTWAFVPKGRKRYVCWSTSRSGKRQHYFLHRLILGAQPGQIVDHIDGNTLNNARSNLRFVSYKENARNALRNKPGFKGVRFDKNGWDARIYADGVSRHLGRFERDVEAAFAYDMASLELHGAAGRRNFLPLVGA